MNGSFNWLVSCRDILYWYKILQNAGIKLSKDPEAQQMFCPERWLTRDKFHFYAPVCYYWQPITNGTVRFS